MNIVENSKRVFKDTWQHFLTGNSYMLPMLIIGCMVNQLLILINPPDTQLWLSIREISSASMSYFVPIMAAFTAYSVAENIGLVPGFICGIIAKSLGIGYFGAFIGGLLVGYFTVLLIDAKIHEKLSSIWGMLIPFLSTVITVVVLVVVVKQPLVWFTDTLSNFILNLGQIGGGIMGAIIGILGGVDYGGVFSKIQSTFATLIIDENIFTPLGICGAAVAVPPLGMCLAAYLKPNLYSEYEIEYAKSNWITSLISGFTEVVIPFAMEDGKNVVIATALGSAVTGIIAGVFELNLYVPVLGVLQWFFYDKPLVFALSSLAGIVTVALSANYLKARSIKKSQQS